jgi:serine/threonine-protein kinase RIO1
MPSDRPRGTRLSAADFKRGQLAEQEIADLLDTFGGQGLIEAVVDTINDGKEATVYRCRANASLGVEYLAAKVYRARKFRAFSNDSTYMRGAWVGDRRLARAIRGRSETGLVAAHHMWIEREWQTLCDLRAAGADVPATYAHSSDAVLMEYVCSPDGRPAPRLVDVRLPRDGAAGLLSRLLGNVELMLLSCNCIHGDLSAYNTLVFEDQRGQIDLRIIDMPQSADARTTPEAEQLLRRDVSNVCDHFSRRYATDADGPRIAGDLWNAYARPDR